MWAKKAPDKYVRPRNTRTKMYADSVACCPLVSHDEYARPRKVRKETGQAVGRTDGRTVIYTTLTARQSGLATRLMC